MKRKKRFNIPIFIMAMMGVVFLFIFNYIPMAGILIAFKDMDYVLNISRSFASSDFVGLENFEAFLKDPEFIDIMLNTLGLNILQLLLTFPAPIIFAILLSELLNNRLKKIVQTVTYFPYFISWVVFGGIVISLLSPENGIINEMLVGIGLIEEPISFATKPEYTWGIVIISSLLKGLGWGSVIYIAAIAGIDPSLFEAATIDGANRLQKAVFVTVPSIMGTIIVLLLLAISGLLSSSFDQMYVLQNPLNISRSEVLDTYIYKVGISQMRYGFTTAIGLFKSFTAMFLLMISHFLSKKIVGRGLF